GQISYLPLFLHLRYYNSNALDFDSYIENYATSIFPFLIKNDVQQRSLRNNIIFILDGLDEISKNTALEVKKCVDYCLTEFPASIFIISTRPIEIANDFSG